MFSNVWQAGIVSIFFAFAFEMQRPEPTARAKNGLGETGECASELVTIRPPKESLTRVLYKRNLRIQHFNGGLK